MIAGEGLHCHDGVDAAAEWDEGPTGFGIEGSRWRCRCRRTNQAQAPEVEAVAVGELAEAVDVVRPEELPLGRGRLQLTQVDDGGRGGLVVRHARQQIQDAYGGHHCGVLPVAGLLEGEAFRERVVGRRVVAGDGRVRRVDGEAVVAEPVGWRHAVVGWPGGPGLPMLRRSRPGTGPNRGEEISRRGVPAGRTARRGAGHGR